MSNKRAAPPLSEEEINQVALLFKLLGEPMRLKILQAICSAPLAVNDIVNKVGASQANVSKHLSLLTSVGVLVRQKKGQKVFYGLKNLLVVQLCKLVHSHTRP